jgi:hypothetical protein
MTERELLARLKGAKRNGNGLLALCPDLRTAMVYEYLVRHCLNLYVDTARDIERHWGFEAEEIGRLELRSVPSFITNLFGSDACAERFGDLSDIPGFYRCRDHWWLDIDEPFARRGVIVPIRDPQRPTFITGLRVFRHVRDLHPFVLRVRQERVAA